MNQIGKFMETVKLASFLVWRRLRGTALAGGALVIAVEAVMFAIVVY